MAHNSSCETSHEPKCVCECGGQFHGIHNQTTLENYIDNDILEGKIIVIAQ